MNLKSRLDALRRQSGAAPVIPHEPDGPLLGDRVRRMQGNVRAVGRLDERAVAERVGGEPIAPGVVLVEQRIGLTARHGERSLADVLASGPVLPAADGVERHTLLFLDTETSGLAGGSGTVVFMLGMARIEGGSLCVRQYLLTAFSGEAALYQHAREWVGVDATLVSFNGKCFDVPLLSARSRLAGETDPFTRLPHLDLLHPTRRAFGTRWPDCRLSTSESRLLGFTRTDDLPGSEAPQVWLDLIRRGDCRRMPAVLRHNLWDLLSLVVLLPALGEVHDRPTDFGADVGAIARSHRRSGNESRALALLALSPSLGAAERCELARLYARQGDWDRACVIWNELAEAGCSESVERLAKFYEHRAGDFELALQFARRLPHGAERTRREQRLRARLSVEPC